jgi:hypothetical protein
MEEHKKLGLDRVPWHTLEEDHRESKPVSQLEV